MDDYIDYLDKMGSTYVTLKHNNIIIGAAGYEVRPSDNSGRINWILVDPAYSGKGFGKDLVNYCLKILKANSGVEKLIVRTTQHVYIFFEKMGYQLVHTEKDYWAPGMDLYLMEQIIR